MRDIAHLVGRRCGIVQTLEKASIDFDDPNIYAYGAKLCDTSAFGGESASRKCGGGGITEDEAKLCCLGEAVERYCAGVWHQNDLIWKAKKDLRVRAFPIEELSLFSSKQHQKPLFPYQKPNIEHPIPWLEVTRYQDEKKILCPACFFLLPSPHHNYCISPPISTGLACHTSFEEAYLRGLCECIERDAIGLVWLRGVAPHFIEGFRQEKRVASLLKDYRGEVTVGDITSDQKIPTYFCLMEGRSPCGNIISFGAACDFDSDNALYRAIREAALGRIYVKRLIKSNPKWNVGYQFQNVYSFERHASFYSVHSQYQKKLSFLKSGKKISYERRIAKNTIANEVYYRDLTSPEIREFGLHVVKVWVPNLLPLHGHHLLPFLGNSRLNKVEKIYPNCSQTYTKGHNPWPHPMP